MNTQQTLSQLQSNLNEILQTFNQKFDKLSDKQIAWKPSPEKWSVAECLQHLNIANCFYVKKVDVILSKIDKSEFPVKSNFDLSFQGKIFVNYIIDPKTKYKFSAPKVTKPGPDLDISKLKTKFVEIINALQRQIVLSESLNLERIKIASPFTNLLKFTLGDVYMISARHTQRHVNQALRVIDLAEFPK